MKTTITMTLRVAVKNDFFNSNNEPLYGRMYFTYSYAQHKFDTKPYYFTEYTDKNTFRALYRCKQLFVLEKLFDDVEINNQ